MEIAPSNEHTKKIIRGEKRSEMVKKAKTRDERLKAMSFSVGKALPNVSKMESEERERLFGPKRRRVK